MLARIRKDLIARLPLSPREKEVLHYLAAGHSNPEMAALLNISLNTVKFHNKQIFDKLGVDSRTALIHRIDDMVLKEVMKARQTA